MPIVLVHGNPETDAIWDELRSHLGRSDVIALSPPGFGAPVPEGFGATSDDYVSWLASELEAAGRARQAMPRSYLKRCARTVSQAFSASANV